MIKNIWPPRLLLWALTAILLAGLTLAACGGAAEPPSEQGTVPAQAEATGEVEAVAQDEPATVPAQEETQEAVATAVEPTSAAEPTPADSAAVASEAPAVAGPPAPAECSPVDIPANELIAAVTETEWSKGPADAPVTLIEYGDFQ
jgi:hypothetical protein